MVDVGITYNCQNIVVMTELVTPSHNVMLNKYNYNGMYTLTMDLNSIVMLFWTKIVVYMSVKLHFSFQFPYITHHPPTAMMLIIVNNTISVTAE